MSSTGDNSDLNRGPTLKESKKGMDQWGSIAALLMLLIMTGAYAFHVYKIPSNLEERFVAIVEKSIEVKTNKVVDRLISEHLEKRRTEANRDAEKEIEGGDTEYNVHVELSINPTELQYFMQSLKDKDHELLSVLMTMFSLSVLFVSFYYFKHTKETTELEARTVATECMQYEQQRFRELYKNYERTLNTMQEFTSDRIQELYYTIDKEKEKDKSYEDEDEDEDSNLASTRVKESNSMLDKAKEGDKNDG